MKQLVKPITWPKSIKMIDLIPALSGLIGKVALVSSFAFVWAEELAILSPYFIFENVRIEIIIGSLITLGAALFFPFAAPSGTLAPLIVLIPIMVRYGVHPLILSLMVGLIGLISVRTKLFTLLLSLSGPISKTSLALVFGISGVLMSVKKLFEFFGRHSPLLYLLLACLIGIYFLLLIYKKMWLVIPICAVVSLILPLLFGMKIDISAPAALPHFNPFYWWQTMWGVGFGFTFTNFIKSLPFALFVVLLWTIDTVSIQAVAESNMESRKICEKIDLEKSFSIASIRNIIGGLYGGAQTSSLWRSFLIPLFMIQRPMQPSAILLGILGIIAGLTGSPIKILSFAPVIWTVLLFGIFVPFVNTGIKNLKNLRSLSQQSIILLATAAGIFFNPLLTWLGAVCYEKLEHKFK
jgi:hypothetical protein